MCFQLRKRQNFETGWTAALWRWNPTAWPWRSCLTWPTRPSHRCVGIAPAFFLVVKSVQSSLITNHYLSDRGLISVGEAGNDCEDQSHRSCDLCQLHQLQHSHWGVFTHTHTHQYYPQSIFDQWLTYILHIFSHKLKKDPDSPDATPPSTPSSSLSSKPLLQGNGSMDSRTRQRKRKKVRNNH